MKGRFFLPLAALAAGIFLLPASADDAATKAKASVSVQFELAKIKASPSIRSFSEHLTYEQAVGESRASHRPVFVSVGLQCKSVCGELRPELITCHEDELGGDKTPRAILMCPTSEGTLWRVQQWSTLPSPAAIRSAIETWLKAQDEARRAHPELSVSDELLESLVLGMTALDAGDWVPGPCPGGFCPNCPTGRCQNTQSISAEANGQQASDVVSYSYSANPEYVEAAVTARFPRLAAIRNRFHGRRGFAPRLSGRFFTYTEAAPTVIQPAAEVVSVGDVATARAARGIFSDHPLYDHFITNHVVVPALNKQLATGGLTADQQAQIKATLGNHRALSALTQLVLARAEASPHAASLTDSSAAIGRLQPGTIQNFLNWIVQNWPAIFADVTELLKLLGVIH
jgi:hypothetical protein